MFRKILMIQLLLMFSLSSLKAEVIGRIAAVVNDSIITTSDLKTERQKIMRGGLIDENILTREELKKIADDDKKLLNHLVNLALIDSAVKTNNKTVTMTAVGQSINERARQLGLTRAQLVNSLKSQGLTLSGYQDFIKINMERQKVIGSEIASKIIISNEEITNQIMANNKSGEAYLYQYQLAHIFFDKSKADSATRAKKALGEVNTRNFLSLAEKYSDDQSDDGYLLGTFKTGDMLKSIDVAIAPIKEGDITNIVNSPNGLHIIKVISKKIIPNPAVNKLRAEYDMKLRASYFKDALANWLKESRQKSFVKINI